MAGTGQAGGRGHGQGRARQLGGIAVRAARRADDHGCVVAAETKRVGQHRGDGGAQGRGHRRKVQRWIDAAKAHIGWNDAVADSDGGHHGFDGAGRAQGVAGGPFGRGERRQAVAEKGVDGAGLGQIVVGCAGAVQVDIVDGRRVEPGIRQGGLHGSPGPLPVRKGGGGVVGVARQAGAEQLESALGRRFSRQQQQGRPFGHGQAAALAVQGPRPQGIDELQRLKAEIGQAAEAVHAAGQHALGLAAAQQLHGQQEGHGA